jgi:dolichyl-phosphate-mannose--protein O-mannosyl transferase
MPWTYGLPLVGLAVTYVPWLLYPERTIFQFYTVVMVPFLVLALVFALRDLAGRREDPLYRRQAGERTVMVVLVAVVLVSAFFYPVWTGMNVPYDFWLIHNWMPTWV